MKNRSLLAFVAGWLLASTSAEAQIAPPPVGDEITVLSPFTVISTGDRGYQPQSTLGGSRLRTDLKDVASPTTGFTEQFLSDVAITNTDDLARYMLSTEYDWGEDSGPGQNFIKESGPRQVRMRGVPGGSISVNFFKSDFPADTFNMERVDQTRGPNSVLFGMGKAGGLTNVTNKRGLLGKNTGSASVQGRSEGGLREEADYNQALGNNVAVRVSAVKEQRGSWRNYEFNDSDRYYITGRWRISQKTELNLDAEKTIIKKQTKRSVTASDAYTLWRDAGSKLSTAANAALGIAALSKNKPYLVLDTASGSVTDWMNKTTTVIRKSVDGDNLPITDFSILPKETTIYGPGFDQDTKYSRIGAYLTHAFTPNLSAELAALRTSSRFDTWDPQSATSRALYVDTNLTLPSGAANPNAGKTYFDGAPQVTFKDETSDSVRMTLAYRKDMGRWGTHTLAGVYEYDFTKQSIWVMREQIISPNAPNLTSAVSNDNRITPRTYVDITGPSSAIVMAPISHNLRGTVTISGKTYTTAIVPINANSQLNSNNDRTTIGMLQSSFWRNRIKTILGTSTDTRQDYASTVVDSPVPGFASGTFTPVRSHTPTKVAAKNSLSFSGIFQPTDWLGLTYSQATNRSLPNSAGRLNTTSSDLNSFSRPPMPQGKSQDVGIKLDLFKNRLFLNAQYFQTTAARDFGFGNINNAINPIWDALASAGKVPSGTSSNSSALTFDTRTQGYEVELTANFTDHWRTFLNYSNAKTARTNIGREELAYIATWRPLWEANQALPLTSGNDTIATQLVALDAATFANFTLADGKLPLGQIRQKLNLVTNYDFSRGALKGFTVGGGVRYTGKPVIGYTATGTPTALVRTVYYGSEQIFVDVNAAYRRKVNLMGKSVMWSLQTNINNVLNNDAIVRLSQASDGTLVNYRFNPPLEWIITTRFSF